MFPVAVTFSCLWWNQTENANYAANDNTMYKITGTVVPGTVLPDGPTVVPSGNVTVVPSGNVTGHSQTVRVLVVPSGSSQVRVLVVPSGSSHKSFEHMTTTVTV